MVWNFCYININRPMVSLGGIFVGNFESEKLLVALLVFFVLLFISFIRSDHAIMKEVTEASYLKREKITLTVVPT
jgi:hypothetical protein